MSDLINKLGNASRAVYIACPEAVADDISGLLRKAGERIALLEAENAQAKHTIKELRSDYLRLEAELMSMGYSNDDLLEVLQEGARNE